MPRTRDLRLVVGVALWLMAGLAACGGGAAPSPFTGEEQGGAAGSDGGGGKSSGGRPMLDDPTIGGPCVDDGQCDDGADCSDDSCDRALGRCRFLPIHSRCADDVYCNGIEVCQPSLGCQPSEPVACSDGSSCTIDRCIEETRSCEHTPRDADGDGDPVWNCGGSDCDDDDAEVNGSRSEICNNERDDDCDQTIDEDDCSNPEHDTCAEALVVDAPGTFELSLVAASADAVLSCGAPGARRDVVVALEVTEPGRDIVVTARSSDKGLALAAFDDCTKTASELGCFAAVELPEAGSGLVARLRLSGLETGFYPLYVSGQQDASVTLEVDYREAVPVAENETCGTALELPVEEGVIVDVTGAKRDVKSACSGSGGELFYRFDLSEPMDVILRAFSLDGFGVPHLSLRSRACTKPGDELDCRLGSPVRLFERALPAGTYFVGVGSSGPTEIELRLRLEPPSEALPGEGCADPPPIRDSGTLDLELLESTNAVASACLPGAVDATYSLHLAERSDVLLVGRLSRGDIGAVSLLAANCAADSALACVSSASSPVRARAFGVPPGEYAVVAESAVGSPVALTTLTRPAVPATLVAVSDSCTDAVLIPETGGRFRGNTKNASPDFDAGCDYGGVQAGGAPEQILRLHLEETRRAVFDMSGSDFDTLLDVRRASPFAPCPGEEIAFGCAPGRDRNGDRSFVDLVLSAGDYFIQVDGFNGASGSWNLDVYVAPP